MVTFFKTLFLTFFISSCTSLIYYPDKYLYATPEQFNIKFEAFTFASIDQTKLSAWRLYSSTPTKKGLMLFFHGNAQNLTAHFINLAWLTEEGYDIIIFDFRGYGLSEGSPDPKGIAEDGLAFFNYGYNILKKENIKKFIIYTQSLGGAVALKSLEDFKHRDKINLLVLDSTFLSPQEVAEEKSFWPLSKIIPNTATADPKLAHLTMPVLSIHATEDPVIAYSLGQKLFGRIHSSPKKEFWTLKAKGHGDVFFIEEKKYRLDFVKFLDNLLF